MRRKGAGVETTVTENPLKKEYWLGMADPRPLALFRILFSLVVLVDYLHRIPYVRAFLSDEGFAPRDSIPPGYAPSWSLFWYAATPAAVMALYLAGCAAVAAVAIGYRTRLAQAAMFVFAASLAGRNPAYGAGPDHFIGVMSFWLLFADSGAVWSLDWLLDNRRTRAVPALSLRFLQWQFGVVLLFTSLAKWPTWRDGLGIYHVTQYRDWVTPLGASLGAWPSICVALNWLVLTFEILIPLLLIALAPLARSWCRGAGMIAGAGLFAGMYLFVWVGSWPELMLAALALFALPEWFDRLDHRLGQRLDHRLDHRLELASNPDPAVEPIPIGRRILAGVLGAQFAVAVWSVTAQRLEVPEGGAVRGELLQLDLEQKWMMFARPVAWSARWTDTGTLADGSQRDVFAAAVPEVVAWPPPEAHWRETRQQIAGNNEIRDAMMRFACREFNRRSPVPAVEVALELRAKRVVDPGTPPVEEQLLNTFRRPCAP